MKAFALALLCFSQVSFAYTEATPPKPGEVPKTAPDPEWVYPTPEPKPAQPLKAEDVGDRHFKISLGFNTGTKLNFKEVTSVTGSTRTESTSEMETSAPVEVGVSYLSVSKNDWGYSAGINYQTKRQIQSERINSGGTSVYSHFGTPAEIQITLIDGGGIYRFESFFIPFGVNYSIPVYLRPGGQTKTVSVHGALGLQGGLGYYIDESFVIELQFKLIGIKATSDDGTTTFDYGTGYMRSFSLTAGLLF
jgi:hypothetical protein